MGCPTIQVPRLRRILILIFLLDPFLLLHRCLFLLEFNPMSKKERRVCPPTVGEQLSYSAGSRSSKRHWGGAGAFWLRSSNAFCPSSSFPLIPLPAWAILKTVTTLLCWLNLVTFWLRSSGAFCPQWPSFHAWIFLSNWPTSCVHAILDQIPSSHWSLLD